MKRIFLTTAFFIGLFCFTALAQAPDSIKAKIAYSFSHMEDTTHREKPYTEDMILLLGKNASVYTSLNKILQDEARKKEIEEQMKMSPTNGFNIQLKTPSRRTNVTEYYQFANEKKLFIKQRLVNIYLMEEPLPLIDWNISSDTASYSGLKCQKATAHFKGRDYTAWFCPDIPFPGGPWKLNGLPGLIIEAYDRNKEVVFKFNGLETVKNNPAAEQDKTAGENSSNDNRNTVKIIGMDDRNILHSNLISLPKDAIRTTQKEFDKLKEAMKRDPAGFVNSSMAGSGVVIKGANTTIQTTTNKAIVNNPLELPER